MKRRILGSALATVLLASAGLSLIGSSVAIGGSVAATPPCAQSGVFPPWSHPHGHTYADWSIKAWQWGLNQPVDGHPFVDSPSFDVASGQSGQVWYLWTPIDGSQAVTTVTRHCTIPPGKSLFVTLLASEWSDLEGYATEQEQRDNANFFGDHIVNLTCTLDGKPIGNLDSFRFETSQFEFTAPSPWIFGATGGTGNAVADGYYVFLEPMSIGHHTLHITGAFHFAIAEGDPFDFDAAVDTTYHLNVTPH